MLVKYSYDKNNKYYYLRKNGKKIASASTVEKLEEKLRVMGLLVQYTIAEKNTMTVKDSFADFLSRNDGDYRIKTQKNYVSYLESKFNYNNKSGVPFKVNGEDILDKLVCEIDRTYVLLVLKQLKLKLNNYSDTSIQHYYGLFKNCINQSYIHYRELGNNPMDDTLLKFDFEKGKGWSPTAENAIKLLNAVSTYCKPSHALATHLCARGCRISEANALRVHHFDFGKKEFYIEKMVDDSGNWNKPKSKSSKRYVKMDDELALMVRQYIIGKKSNDLLFPSPKNKDKPIGQKTLRKNGLHKAIRKIRETDPDFEWRNGFHSLRHYYGSIVMKHGFLNKKNPLWASKQMGHSDIRTTATLYNHIIDPDETDGNAISPMKLQA
jgi:integrase|tara:strand:+ start:4 stop:1143 length:1140 start_codon:yes stop_codon:yes gene_type:complete